MDKFRAARLSEDFSYIMDSKGKRVDFNDPRVVHVLTDLPGEYAGKIAERVYRKFGKTCRSIGNTDETDLQYARKICSGRECLPMLAMTGAAVRDMYERRTKGEITIYCTLDQEGPCQNGAWPSTWDTFLERLQIPDILGGVSRLATPGQLGLEGKHSNDVNASSFLGDLMEEAHNTLACLAVDKKKALSMFERAFKEFLDVYSKRDTAMDEALGLWARRMKGIPLKMPVEEVPKVLIFGGLNILFLHYPVTRYFIGQGVLPKVVEAAEGACFIESEGALRYGMKAGYTDPDVQFSIKPPAGDPMAVKSRKSMIAIRMADNIQRKFRLIMEESGLMFDHHISFLDVIEAGNKHISINTFTETTTTTGRFTKTIRDGYYNGLVNIGSFNCQPAMNSQAILRRLANQVDIPYVAVDMEGPWLSANQRRLLEMVAVAAKR